MQQVFLFFILTHNDILSFLTTSSSQSHPLPHKVSSVLAFGGCAAEKQLHCFWPKRKLLFENVFSLKNNQLRECLPCGIVSLHCQAWLKIMTSFRNDVGVLLCNTSSWRHLSTEVGLSPTRKRTERADKHFRRLTDTWLVPQMSVLTE